MKQLIQKALYMYRRVGAKNVPTLRHQYSVRLWQRSLLLFVAVVINTAAWAAPVDTFVFKNNDQEELFKKLSDELRCLVCQNQNIADSNSGLAQDLRLEIYNMITSGQTESEIIDFMVQRYGDYVLYRPPFKPLTWLLWFGPVIIFIGGMIYAIRIIRAKENNTVMVDLSSEDDERLKNLRAENKTRSQNKEDQNK